MTWSLSCKLAYKTGFYSAAAAAITQWQMCWWEMKPPQTLLTTAAIWSSIMECIKVGIGCFFEPKDCSGDCHIQSTCPSAKEMPKEALLWTIPTQLQHLHSISMQFRRKSCFAVIQIIWHSVTYNFGVRLHSVVQWQSSPMLLVFCTELKCMV